jgi:hypothetical protein
MHLSSPLLFITSSIMFWYSTRSSFCLIVNKSLLSSSGKDKERRLQKKQSSGLQNICLYVCTFVFEFVRIKWRGRLWLQSRPMTYVTYQRSRDIWFQHPKSQPKSFSAFFIIYVKVWHVFSIFCVHLGEKITKLSSIRHVQYSQDIILQFFFFFFTYLLLLVNYTRTQ